jgi:predicted DNA-binding transcriptional regulator YafY/predicted transcriptional regulator YdeE
MASDKPRLTRLTAIITQLQSKRIVTARDIAEKHKVSIRTVYRDIRTLESSGIPILTEEGKGYSIMEGYKLPPVMFSEEETQALITAELLLLKNKDQSLAKHYQSALTKIKSVLKINHQIKTEFLADRIQIRDNPTQEKTSDHLIQLQSAIADFKTVKINYLSLDNFRSERKVEPFAVYTTQGNWILIAFCQLKKGFRAFRLDRIQGLAFTGKNFAPHSLTLNEYLEECRKKWETPPDTRLSPDAATFALHQKNNDVQTVKIEPFKVIGIAIRTTNEHGQAAQDIGELWGKFMGEQILGKIPNKVDNTVYSLYTDYEGDHNKPYTAMIGCKVVTLEDIPANMVGKSLSGGNYIKTTTKGNLNDGIIVKHWNKIWEMDLDRTYDADFEVFGEKAQNPLDAEIEFLVGVK